MNCHSCKELLDVNEIFDRDDDGNVYHYDCGMRLRSKFDDDRQENMTRDMSEEFDGLASAEGDYLRKVGYTADF